MSPLSIYSQYSISGELVRQQHSAVANIQYWQIFHGRGRKLQILPNIWIHVLANLLDFVRWHKFCAGEGASPIPANSTRWPLTRNGSTLLLLWGRWRKNSFPPPPSQPKKVFRSFFSFSSAFRILTAKSNFFEIQFWWIMTIGKAPALLPVGIHNVFLRCTIRIYVCICICICILAKTKKGKCSTPIPMGFDRWRAYCLFSLSCRRRFGSKMNSM